MPKDLHLTLKFKNNEKPLNNILAFTTSVGGACSHYRLFSPAKYLTQEHNINYHVSNNFKLGYPDERMPLYQSALLDIYRKYDTFVFQREFRVNVFEFMKIAQDVGKIRCINEIDDDFESILESSPSYKDTQTALPKMRYFWAHSNVLTCTTEPLKEVLSKYNKNIHVIPNAIDFDYFDPWVKKNYERDTIIIGWTGSPYHFEDIAFIEQYITDVVNKYDNVKFLYAGHFQKRGNIQYEFFKGIPNDKKIILPSVPICFYPKLLSMIDIGIAPLANNKFNESKSNLKYLEYSALGIPSVCSDIYPYRNTITNGEDGFIAGNSFKSWQNALELLINDFPARKTIGEAAREMVYKKFNIKDVVNQWKELFIGGNKQ